MSDLKIPGKSVLELKGKGKIVDAEGDGSYFYGFITSDLKVYLDGKDITATVKHTEDYVAFIVNKILEQESNLDYWLSAEIEFPPSIFLLPENADPELIELLPIKKELRNLYEGGFVADYIIYDGDEYEAESYQNDDELLNCEFGGIQYDNNWEFYNNNGPDSAEQTGLYRF